MTEKFSKLSSSRNVLLYVDLKAFLFPRTFISDDKETIIPTMSV